MNILSLQQMLSVPSERYNAQFLMGYSLHLKNYILKVLVNVYLHHLISIV